MPELPEVEVIVRYLRPKLVGLKIIDFWSDWEKEIRHAHLSGKQSDGIRFFKKEIKNGRILGVYRRAKYIIIDIEGAYSIFIHQKISGHLLYGHWAPEIPNSNPPTGGQIPNKFQIPKNLETIKKWVATDAGPLKEDRENQYIRAIWLLNNGYQLAFSDLRRFGKIILVKDNELSALPEIKELGPEPLGINLKEFSNLFSNKRGRLKQVLMDPYFIAGIGNIYSDEILWDSGFHPLSRVENLKEVNLKKIFNSTIKILKKAIRAGGASVEDYRKPSGEKGKFQDYTKAYHQTSKKCAKKDGGIIERIKIGGRSAHFCSRHQMLR